MRKCIASLLTLILLSLARTVVAAVPSHAVVFVYHRFGDERYPSTNIRLGQFDAQLNWLADNHYQVWSLPKIVNYLQQGKPIPDHVVAITIDDAFQSVYENAYPRLRARDWPFTVFVSTAAVDAKLPDYMTWDEMREMKQHGVTFGDHTVDHAHMVFRRTGENDLSWADRSRDQILKAQTRLQQELGTDTNAVPKLFAYPYGEYDQALAQMVTGLGYTAFGQESGVLSAPLDPRALPRYPVNEHYGDIATFELKADSLPLPVLSATPWNPLVRGSNPPRLEITLQADAVSPDALHCYLNGPSMPIDWLDGTRNRFALQATEPMSAGRTRYNCTAQMGGRYYWYSHMWLLPP
ncbi:MAG: polysaccharide deacetylase family protein [Gammaproteobacteria bacterium]